MQPTVAPKVFISYSWDGDAHQEWVRQFALRLREEGGIDAILDQWHTVPGEQLTHFMGAAVRESDFVLIICTPGYKAKSDRGVGGVGYEGDIMTGEILTVGNHSKFIPILREGDWKDAAPSWLAAKFYIKCSGSRLLPDESFEQLLRTLHRQRPSALAIGIPQKFIDGDLLSIAKDVASVADEILDKNQSALVPFLMDPRQRYSVGDKMTTLFHDQSYRSRFAGWRSFLGSIMQSTRNPDHLSTCKRLHKEITALHSAFYSYGQSVDEKGEPQTHKHFVELVLGNRGSDPRWYCLPDEELNHIAQSYLETIRRAVDNIGAIKGELQAQ